MPHPLFVVGVALWMASALSFMVVLFTNGGINKAHQIGALLDLLGGHRGPKARMITVGSLLGMLLGAGLLFTGVSASDSGRRDRCLERCAAAGYATGQLGPSEASHPDRPNAAAFLACTCMGRPDQPPLELRADER